MIITTIVVTYFFRGDNFTRPPVHGQLQLVHDRRLCPHVVRMLLEPLPDVVRVDDNVVILAVDLDVTVVWRDKGDLVTELH